MPFEEDHEGLYLLTVYNRHFAVVNVLLERPIHVILDKRVSMAASVVLPCWNQDRPRPHPVSWVYTRPEMQIGSL